MGSDDLYRFNHPKRKGYPGGSDPKFPPKAMRIKSLKLKTSGKKKKRLKKIQAEVVTQKGLEAGFCLSPNGAAWIKTLEALAVFFLWQGTFAADLYHASRSNCHGCHSHSQGVEGRGGSFFKITWVG